METTSSSNVSRSNLSCESASMRASHPMDNLNSYFSARVIGRQYRE